MSKNLPEKIISQLISLHWENTFNVKELFTLASNCTKCFFLKFSFPAYLNKTRTVTRNDLHETCGYWFNYSILTVHSPRGLEFNGKSTRVCSLTISQMTRKSLYSRLHAGDTNSGIEIAIGPERRNGTIRKVHPRLRYARPQGIFRDPILAELGSRYNDVTRWLHYGLQGRIKLF